MTDPPQVERPARLGPGFWSLWSSSTLSNLADGLVKVALPVLAVTLTQSPVLVAGVATAETLPWLLFALPAGALADRLDRRRMMLYANGVRALVLAAVALVAVLGTVTLPVIYAAAVVAGTAEVFYDTAAQSLLPRLVDRDQLTRANGRLFAAELTANEFIGPPLGGVLVTAGAVLAFSAPAGLWVLAIGTLLLVRGSFRAERGAPTSLRRDIGDGFRLLWRTRVLRTLTIMTGGFNLASSAVVAVFVVYAVGATSAMGLTAAQYGLVLTGTAAGSLAGSFIAGAVERRLGPQRSMALGMVLGAFVIGIPAVTTNPFVVVAGYVVGGAGLVLWNVVAVSLRQRITPDTMLGRITGAHRLFAWGSRPIGAALGGVLGQFVGLRAVFIVMTVLVLSLLIQLRHLSDAAIRAAEATDRPS